MQNQSIPWGQMFASGGVSGGFGTQGQIQAFGLNAKQASKSWDKWKDSQTRGPTYAMIGLEKAGINPIIAAGGGIHAGASGRAPQGQGVGNLPSPALTAAAQMKQMNASTELLKTQEETTRLLGNKHVADTQRALVETYLKSLEAPERLAIANWATTGPGRNILIQGKITDATPTTFPQAISRLAMAMASNPALREQVMGELKKLVSQAKGSDQTMAAEFERLLFRLMGNN